MRKLPLTAACVDVDYDVTRPQPQLFVTRDFAELEEVLEAVTATLAFRIGGDQALRAAHESAELATLTLDSGALVMGTLASRVSYRAPLVALGFAGLVLFVGASAEITNAKVAAALDRRRALTPGD